MRYSEPMTNTATATGDHYTVSLDTGEVVEFNERRAFAFVVMGRTSYHGEWWVMAKTNASPQAAEKRVRVRMGRNWPTSVNKVVTIPVVRQA